MAATDTTARSAFGAIRLDSPAPTLVLVVCINAGALTLFTCLPYAAEYSWAALGIVAFLLAQLLLPACRPNWETPICPANLAQAFFWVQLVLVALLIGRNGIEQGTLPYLPGAAAIRNAVILRALAYLSFCVAYQCTGATTSPRDRPQVVAGPGGTPFWLVGAFVGIGLLGQWLAYGSVGGFIELASSPVVQREREALPTTLAGAASTFLRPFLGFALILLWAAWLQGGKRPRRLGATALATAVLTVLLLLANFSYNRGSLVTPLIGVAAAFSAHVRRISVPAIVLAGVLLLLGALTFGWYRATSLEITDVDAVDVRETWSEESVTEFIQIYASGPQMTAYLIEQRGADSPLYWGRSLVSSVLSPVPVIGKAYREESGHALLNTLIYQDPDIADQTIPYDAELYINFDLAGVILGYAVLGWLIRLCQRAFPGRHASVSYAVMMLSFWLIFPGNLAVLSQMCVYFFWPFYLYFAANRLEQGRCPS
jgi:hypothetical protein